MNKTTDSEKHEHKEVCDVNIDIGENGMIYLFYEKNNIKKIKYLDGDVEFVINLDWNDVREIFHSPKNNLITTFEEYLESLSEYNYDVLSSSSVISGGEMNVNRKRNSEYLKNIFMRGLSSVIVLMKLNRMGRYFKQEIEGAISVNNMKLLRMMIHFHVTYNNDSSLLLQYCLDFINRWSGMLQIGDKVDKYNFLSLLITSYIKDRRDDGTSSNDSVDRNEDVEKRLKRIEKILGIN